MAPGKTLQEPLRGAALGGLDPRREPGTSSIISGPSFCGKSHLFYSLVKNFEVYHRTAAKKIIIFAAVPTKEEYQTELAASLPLSTPLEVLPLSELASYVFVNKEECLLIDDLQGHHLEGKAGLKQAITNLVNITCHQLRLYVYIIVQINLKDKEF